MLPEFVDSALQTIEKSISSETTQTQLLHQLRRFGLGDFGLILLSMPNPDYPQISRHLPRMASEEIQRNWTGSCGVELLTQTTEFVRAVADNYCRLTGDSLEGKEVLDFGCGYGRIARLMYFFTNPENIYGVDPWDESISICRADGFTEDHFLISEYLPTELPTGEKCFDLIYAFSVFTHLSERSAALSLRILLHHVKPGGLLVITIRPVEYWNHDQHAVSQNKVNEQIELHNSSGFSFLPHNRPPIDGDITYGDTSMDLSWLENAVPEAEILGMDRSLRDVFQRYIFLKRRDS
ncbi:MAG: class I SAM-dependent methyltransferase [Chromatiaceae bacterium]|nr:class I SAM-dependent methyltransferase [Chromatiaceae bacterium]MCF7994018.1 class I SAM-dependent methyltransferase [Chromatiaceae bacterium]MCF8016916.1 class I SAM-dependent methyltransferase [Chromatiaceae bacterium]